MPSDAFATAPQKVEPGTFIDNKYQWFPSFTKTSVEKNNARYPFTIQSDIYTRDNYHARNVIGSKYYSASELSRIQDAAIRWTGGKYIDGNEIDLVMKVTAQQPNWRGYDGWGGNYNYFYATTVGELNPYHEQLKPGINSGAPLIEFCGYAYLDLSFSFYKTGTNEPFNISGRASFSDFDYGERAKFDGVDHVCISKNNNGIWINSDDSFEAIRGEQVSLENSTVSIYFDCEHFSLRFYGNPWKVGLTCFDQSSLLNVTPNNPIKDYRIER